MSDGTRDLLETVDFRCLPEHEGDVVVPSPADKRYPEIQHADWVPIEFAQEAEHNTKVRDAVTAGWYLYPPEPIAFTESRSPDTDFDVTNGEPYVDTTQPDRGSTGLLEAFIDTLWRVSVPDGFALAIFPPLYDPTTPVRAQVLRETDAWPSITIPVAVTEAVTFHENEPLAQAMLLNAEYLDTDDYAAGVFDETGEAQYEKMRSLSEVYSRPYLDVIRKARPETPLINRLNE